MQLSVKLSFFMGSIKHWKQIGLRIFLHSKLTLLSLNAKKKLYNFSEMIFLSFQYYLQSRITVMLLKVKNH